MGRWTVMVQENVCACIGTELLRPVSGEDFEHIKFNIDAGRADDAVTRTRFSEDDAATYNVKFTNGAVHVMSSVHSHHNRIGDLLRWVNSRLARSYPPPLHCLPRDHEDFNTGPKYRLFPSQREIIDVKAADL